MMKIISGKFKNQKINTHKKGYKIQYKPSKSSVREAVFNLIEHAEYAENVAIDGAKVLDIFCGSGSYGLEALSRGAVHASFITNDRQQIMMLEENIDRIIKIANKSDIISEQEDCADQITTNAICCDARRLLPIVHSFDIIFMDPPYRSGLIKDALKALKNNIKLAEEHLIFVELAAKEPFIVPEYFAQLDVRQYGNTKIYVLRRAG